jgi:hypothetical protein
MLWDGTERPVACLGGFPPATWKPATAVIDEDHVTNFLECLRSLGQSTAPVEIGASLVAALHLANIAYRRGTWVKLSADG